MEAMEPLGQSRHGDFRCEQSALMYFYTLYLPNNSVGEIRREVPEALLVLHGTHGVSDQLFRAARQQGIVKINLNRTVRDEYTEFVAAQAGKLELTVLKMKAVDIYAESISKAMQGFLGSAGMAP